MPTLILHFLYVFSQENLVSFKAYFTFFQHTQTDCSLDIAHTLKQADNLPCTKLQTRTVQVLQHKCPRAGCQQQEVWVCDHFSHRQGDFTFLEIPAANSRTLGAQCWHSGFTKHHDCGIGTTVKEPWRHLDKVTFVQVEEIQRWHSDDK
jgi:hypothetical protein